MKAQHLTELGLKYLMVDIANTYGYDKATTDEQIQFVESNIEVLEAISIEADSPFEFDNAVIALRQHQRGEKVKHMMYSDCSNQALQLYAVLTGDYDTAYICNLSSGSVRTDAYGMLADALNKHFLTEVFNRNNCKKALMTTLYGKRNGGTVILDDMRMQLHELAVELKVTATEDTWFEDAFTEAMNKIAPNAMKAMGLIQDLNDEDIDTYHWTMPDGFEVKYDVKRNIEYEGTRTSKKGINFSFSCSTSIYGGTKFNAGMAPNLIHSVDGYVARQLVRHMGDKYITCIHDAFGVHPNDIQQLKDGYAKVMCEILESDLLRNLMTQIANGRTFKLPIKSNSLTKEHILSSVYAIA